MPRRSPPPGPAIGRWRPYSNLLRVEVEATGSYSLLPRRPERDLLPYAVATGRLLIAWSPLEQGLPAGKYSDGMAPRFNRPSTEYFAPEHLHRAQPVVDPVREVAAAWDATRRRWRSPG